MKRLALISGFILACAGGDSVGLSDRTTGRVQASLTGTPGGGGGKPLGVKEIIVTIDKVTAHSTSAGWVKLSDSEVTVDVLKLAQYAAPLGFQNVPPGKVTQLRLYVKEGGAQYVTRDDGTRIDLKVPSGIQSGIKLHGLFNVAACKLSAVALQFDGKKSIWVHPTGQGDEWILRPVIRTGSVDSTDMACTPPVVGGAGGGSGGPTGAGGGGMLVEGGGNPGGGVDGAGTVCVAPLSCLSGMCIAGFCAKGGAAAPCTVANDCTSNVCALGLCAPGGEKSTGTPCTLAAECLSGTCTAGVCDSGGQGQPCAATTDCLTGYACTAGSCQPPIN